MEQDAGIFAFERADGAHRRSWWCSTPATPSTSETSPAQTGGADMLTSFAAGRPARRRPRRAGDATATLHRRHRRARSRSRSPARGARILVPQADVVPATIEPTMAQLIHRARRQGPRRRRASSATCRSRSPTASCWCWSGPSGCGKSTLLRCIAGLEELDARRDRSSTASTSRAPSRAIATSPWCSRATRSIRT